MSKKPTKFERAVEWIANEDEPSDLDPAVVADYVTTLLIADVFEKPAEEIADLIVKKRKMNQAREKRRK